MLFQFRMFSIEVIKIPSDINSAEKCVDLSNSVLNILVLSVNNA